MTHASKPTLLVLAAGRGERVGGPKALLMIRDRPLAALHLDELGDRAKVVIVTRPAIAEALGDLCGAATMVRSEEPDELGPAGSIRAAVRAGAIADPPKAGRVSVIDDEPVLITPVDVLPRPWSFVEPLLSALATHDAARYERGHPVAVRGSVLRARYAKSALPLRDVLADLGSGCARLALPAGREAAALDDLDTPDDVLRATGALPRFLARPR